jgi:hypothetical protein
MASLKQAIKNYCISCTYDSTQPGTALFQIENCSVVSCKLYEVRPRTVATVNLHRNKRDLDTGNIEALVDGLDDEDEDESSPTSATLTV